MEGDEQGGFADASGLLALHTGVLLEDCLIKAGTANLGKAVPGQHAM